MNTNFKDAKELASEIASAYKSKSKRLPELLYNYYKKNYVIPGLYFEKLSVDGNYLDENVISIKLQTQNLAFLLDILDDKTSKLISDYLDKFELEKESIYISTIHLYTIIQTLEKAGYSAVTVLHPAGDEIFLLVYKKASDATSYYLIHHYVVGNDWLGGYGDSFDTMTFNDIGFNKSFIDFFNETFYSNIKTLGKGNKKLKYELTLGRFGYCLCENLDMINLNSHFFELGIKGMLFAKEYSPK